MIRVQVSAGNLFQTRALILGTSLQVPTTLFHDFEIISFPSIFSHFYSLPYDLAVRRVTRTKFSNAEEGDNAAFDLPS